MGCRSIIRLPSVLPIRIMAPVEIMLRTILVAVPAFSRVEPAMISGPTRSAISRSTCWPSRLGRLQAIPTVAGPSRAGLAHGAQHVGSPARSGNADHEIAAGHAQRRQIRGASIRIVLGPFDGPRERARPAGDQAHDHLRRRAERGGTFRRVEHAQPARSPRPDVNQPPSLPESVGRPFDRLCDRGRLGTDRLDHGGILGIHERHDLASAQRVDRL